METKNIIATLQEWMDSAPGQTFLNYAYSWGAAIVILGTLFKLTYLPGADFFLFLGMGTEVLVFFLSAFDRPFEKREESGGEEKQGTQSLPEQNVLGQQIDSSLQKLRENEIEIQRLTKTSQETTRSLEQMNGFFAQMKKLLGSLK